MRAGIDFVVIGGVAVVIQASPRFTRELDTSYATDTANLERLGVLLVALGARLRGVEEDLPFTPDTRTLRHTQMLTFATRDGDLGLLAPPAPLAIPPSVVAPTWWNWTESRCASRRSRTSLK
jgi:hypothetical protein